MYILLVLIGFIVGILNSLGIKWTIKKVVQYKNSTIIFLSFFIRMTLIFTVFYIFLDSNWRNAIFMLLGLTISKIIFILKERKNYIRK